MIYDMTWYFNQGIERNALLLDGSNLDGIEFPLFTCFKNHINEILEGKDKKLELGYSYPGGKNKLRELIAEHESYLEKVEITADDVIVNGAGATGVINSVAQIIKEEHPNGQVLCPVPVYSGIKLGIVQNGLKFIPLLTKKENSHCVRYQEIVNEFTEDTVAIFLTNPGNPVCNYIENSEMDKIIEFAILKKCYLILDAIFEEAPCSISNYNMYFKRVNNYNKFIKIKGYSKDLPQFCDFRLGWSICKNERLNKKLIDKGEITNYSNSSLLDMIGIKAMLMRVQNDKKIINSELNTYNAELMNYHNKIISTIKIATDFLYQNKIVDTVLIPSAGNVLFIYISNIVKEKYNLWNAHDLVIYILDKTNVLVTPGYIFGLSLEDLCFRVTVSKSKEVFLDGLYQIIRCLE